MTHKLDCTKPFDPAVFMGESWSVAEEDDRAERFPEIDVSAITLVTSLKKDEKAANRRALRDTPQGQAMHSAGRPRLPRIVGTPKRHPRELEGAVYVCVLRRPDPEAPQRQPLLALPLLAPRSMALVLVLAWQYAFDEQSIGSACRVTWRPTPVVESLALAIGGRLTLIVGAGAAPAEPLPPTLQAVLDAHNAYRAKHCVPSLTWSTELAASAQQWANRCDFNHDDHSPHGENMFWGRRRLFARSRRSELVRGNCGVQFFPA